MRDTSPIIGSNDGGSISQNVALLNILVHDVINLLYYEYWTDKQERDRDRERETMQILFMWGKFSFLCVDIKFDVPKGIFV